MREILDKIREFDKTQKLALAGISLLAIVSLIFVIIFATNGAKDIKNDGENNNPNVTQSPKPEPTSDEVTGKDDPLVNPEDLVTKNTEPPIPETPPVPTSSIEFGVTDLSKEEVINAQKTANAGLLEFFKWDKKESAEDRIKRYSPYFVADSLELQQKPDFNIDNNDDTTIYSGAIINYIEPVGGNKDEYVILASAAVDMQYNYDKSLEDSVVVKKTESLTLHMKLDNKTWKIKSIEKSS